MKNAVIAAMVALAISAPAAWGINNSQEAANAPSLKSRVAKLEKQVKTLNGQVRQVRTAVGGLINCLAPIGVVRRGGIVARSSTGDTLTTALDVTNQGEGAQGIALFLNPECIQQSGLRMQRFTPQLSP
jgi:hypothetical protein